MKFIPIPASAGISGFESPASEYKQLNLSLDDLLISHPSSTYIGRVSGESMIEVGIMDGSLLIVDRALNYQNGDVIVANYNGLFVVKQINIPERKLCSANGSYQDIIIAEGDTFSVEGVVIHTISSFRQ
ncbi:translesion error-prone DNA polymerase V autoproteolytic subunit [Vibrio sp. SS-MA-C1-2]|uniref:translesion error-prone DNA polymerase V autoproteolytic subunit n=1 Tax=Vibrio sp. SS-MA-C1-2 TaxID=2908646 RepID=UPI001F307234|nr:translesion error-prone DNA polymerase V autoproteolytic subunit [Vibrio sp. SS-MA-C1-2]UJF17728.1 translesion error-prone DNA polymerase V autoproteolytic subunit [Vibrio sp. SS-MA-C1-2]